MQRIRRILIADDHPLVCRGMTTLIESEPGLEVCGAVGTPEEALASVASSRPDLVITDLSIGGGAGGLALVRDLRAGNQNLPIIVFSMHEESTWTQRVLDAGASGFLSKREMGETLLIAIRGLLAG